MTNRYTNEEWETIISETQRDVVVSQEPYPCPGIADPAFTRTIDHTLLKLDVKAVQIDALCAEARVNEFATVCVRPHFVHRCVSNLKGSNVKVASVIGFHEGTYDLYFKLQETKQSLLGGASELDIVLNWPELKARSYASIFTELATLRLQAPHPTTLKLILETSKLSQKEIIAACTIAAAANFDYVKTSTGFNGHGAKEEDVRLMAACCSILPIRGIKDIAGQGRHMKVKASGGIRTLKDAVQMLQAGADRLGTSGGVWIAKEAREALERSGSPPGAVEKERPGMATRLFTDF